MHFNANIASLIILFCSAMTANAFPFPQNGAAAPVNGEGTVKTSRPVKAAGAGTVPTSRPINPDGSAATPTHRPINPDSSAAYVPYSILKHSIINQISNSRRRIVEVRVAKHHQSMETDKPKPPFQLTQTALPQPRPLFLLTEIILQQSQLLVLSTRLVLPHMLLSSQHSNPH